MQGLEPVLITEPTVRKSEGFLTHQTYMKTEKINVPATLTDELQYCL